MNEIYKINPTMLFSTREGITRVVSMDEDNSDLVVLHGASANSLKLFDGKKNLSEIFNELNKELSSKGSESDFLKLIKFLNDKSIITKVD